MDAKDISWLISDVELVALGAVLGRVVTSRIPCT